MAVIRNSDGGEDFPRASPRYRVSGVTAIVALA
jgi:hypothetical protein